MRPRPQFAIRAYTQDQLTAFCRRWNTPGQNRSGSRSQSGAGARMIRNGLAKNSGIDATKTPNQPIA